MAYQGTVPLEGTLSFLILSTDATGAPIDALSSAPVFTIYDSSGTVTPISNVNTVAHTGTGVYRVTSLIQSSNNFVAGASYNVVTTWQITGPVNKASVDNFRVT